MEYYFKTDFQIVETFTDSTGVPIDLNDFDFELIYQTTGVNNYKAFKKGEVLINCSIDTVDSSKLIVVFQNHKLSCGQLHREIKIKVLNPLFEDYQQIMTHPFTEIYLVQNGGDQTTGYASAGIPIVLPYPETIVTDLADTDYFLGLSLKSSIKTTWLNIKAKLKSYFDGIYSASNHNHNLNDLTEKSYTNLTDKPDLTSLHTHTNKEDLDNVSGSNTGDETAQTIKNKLGITTLSGENTGDETAESIIDKIGIEGQIKSDYLPSLDYSTNIEADKLSTTKVSAIKTLYDWAVGKFIDLSKIVTTWTATTLDSNIPSEKLVKDSLNLKADITPANGSTSALRALFTSVPGANCLYNTATGYYEMNGVTNLTELDVIKSYHFLQAYKNQLSSAYQSSGIRTNYYLGNNANTSYNCRYWCQNVTTLEVFKFFIYNPILLIQGMFYNCPNLTTAETFRMEHITDALNMFFGCNKLVTAYLYKLKTSISFEWSPLLSLASLQYLVTNRQNGDTRITITVHSTTWSKLNDSENYPEWNALLVDAVANQYIDFASA